VISGIRRDMNKEIIGFMGRYSGLESGWCRYFGNSYWFFLHRLNDQRRSTIIHPVGILEMSATSHFSTERSSP